MTLRFFATVWAVTGFMLAAGGIGIPARGQDEPGVSVGVFYERSQDIKASEKVRTFDYYGVRLQWRDARWLTLYADLGLANAEWKDYEMEGAGLFGVGGYFWALRAEDLALPLDIGLHGSVYAGNLEWEKKGDTGPTTGDDSYIRVFGQVVLRADLGMGVRPMLRAGVAHLSGDAPDGGDDGEWNKTRPAVGVGLEVAPHSTFSAVVEGSYMAGPGFAVRLELWF